MKYNLIDLNNLCRYLENNSLLKIYNDEKSQIIFEDFNYILTNIKYTNKTVYRKVKDNFSIGNKFDSCDYTEILSWIKEKLRLKPLNDLNTFKIYSQNIIDYNWSISDVLPNIFLILKKYNDSDKYNIKIKGGYLHEYEETLVFSKGILEYRHYKLLVIDLIITERINNTNFNKSFSISNVITEEELESIFIKLIDEITIWRQYEFINQDDLHSLLGNDITCLVSPNVANSLIHESIGHFSEADVFNIDKNNYQYLKKIIFNKQLNIIDYAHPTGIPTQFYYDDDGTECTDVTIISNGMIMGLLSDTDEHLSEYHKIAGVKRGSLEGDYSIIRMRNTVVSPGECKWEEILFSIKKGLVLSQIDNSITSYDGNFQVYIKEAFYVVDGKIERKINDICLTNNVITFLASITMLGNKSEWEVLMNCNKENMVNYISCCSPPFKCTLFLK